MIRVLALLTMTMPLAELAERIGATLEGDGSVPITGCAPIECAGPSEVTFLANAKYSRFLPTTRAAGVIVHPETGCPPGLTRLVTKNPYLAFRNAMVALHGFRLHPAPMAPACGHRSEKAAVHPEATLGEGTTVHPFAVVERGAVVGRQTVLYPGAYVGPQARVGDECVLYPNAVVYDRCVLGDRVIVHSSAVVGHDGFGFAQHKDTFQKIPQTGIVVVEDDVEIGAGVALERAAMGETRIGRGTKLADLISIGHGTSIGAHCLVVSLVGVSGSVEIGDHVMIGGQVGITGHLKVGDRVQVAARAGIVHDVPDGARVGGVPAVEIGRARRNVLVGRDLAGLARRIKGLEHELRELKQALAEPAGT